MQAKQRSARVRAAQGLGLALLLALFGCGYHFAPSGENIDKRLQKAYVENFGNRTSEANLEIHFRTAFMEQIIQGTRFRLADTIEDADVVLRGRIDNIAVSPLSYRTGTLAAEERISVIMEIVLEEKETKKVLWTDRAFSAYEDYRVEAVGATQAHRQTAIQKLAKDMASKAYRLMLSGF